jgi:glutamate/tyrosine decarboxylase-like PLP-dependent enzyme
MSATTAAASSTAEILRFASERAQKYLAEAQHGRVAPSEKDLLELGRLHEPFPELPADPREVIALLDAVGSPATVKLTGGRYFGFVNSGTLPAALGANLLAAVWDQNAALRVMSPIAAELEDVLRVWVCQALGLPQDCEIGLVTGATGANFTSMITARHALLARAGWNVEEDGMFGAPPIDVVVGAEVHSSMLKALTMAGFGKKRMKLVDVDQQGRMLAAKLPQLSPNTIVCVQAGNVNSGSFDPVAEICALAKDAGAWVHMDGAIGLWAAASPKYRHLLRGFDQADSWATDAHKWPNVNYDCGLVIVRDAQALRAAMTMSGAYLQAGTRREPMYQTPDGSRRARGVELWAALKSLGRTGLAQMIERTCEHAQRFASGLQRASFSILNDVVINQVVVSFGSPEVTRQVVRRIQEDGTCWCGGTVWQGQTAMRISVCSWATTEADVDQSLAAIIRIANDCRKSAGL